ncbi:MAG: hypothetical protein D6754_13615 [Alphaproteobacteria bacterium]|nr:MAG: hypothetical protein D6754_13615 [Alphaproteobacteria bacterium]
MRFTGLAGTLALAIAVSFFLPWLNPPLADPVGPHDLFSQLEARQLRELPPGLLLFLGSFALAGLVALLTLIGVCPRFLALSAGLLPLGLIAYVLSQAGRGLERAGLPLPSGADIETVLDALSKVLELGALSYAGGAVMLVLVALFDPGRSRGA